MSRIDRLTAAIIRFENVPQIQASGSDFSAGGPVKVYPDKTAISPEPEGDGMQIPPKRGIPAPPISNSTVSPIDITPPVTVQPETPTNDAQLSTPFGPGKVTSVEHQFYDGIQKITIGKDEWNTPLFGPKLHRGDKVNHGTVSMRLQYGEIALYAPPGLVPENGKVNVQTPWGAATARLLDKRAPHLIAIKLDKLPSNRTIAIPSGLALAGPGVNLDGRYPLMIPLEHRETIVLGPITRVGT